MSDRRKVTTKLRQLMLAVTVLGLLMGGLVATQVMASSPAFAGTPGTYNNATIATDALQYLGQNPAPGGGQCKAFVNEMVKAASNGTQSPSGYQSGWAALGTQVSSANAAEGDIIQITPAGSTDATAENDWVYGVPSKELHTAIIVSNNGNNSFKVVDANFVKPNTVGEHTFNPYTWANGSIVDIWRLGTVSGGGGGSSLTDGTFFQDQGSTTVYEMVGGAALYVPSWASVGGIHSVTTISPTYYPSIPADGTFIEDYGSTAVYEMLGGAAVFVPSWASVGGTRSPVVIPNTYSFPTTPAGGSLFADYGSTAVYEVVGGAQLWVPVWSDIGGQQPYAVMPSGYSLPTKPADGTFIQDYGYSTVYEIAGGAAFPVPYWGAVGGPQNFTVIPDTVLPSRPLDSTYLQEYGSGTIYTVAGGAAIGITAWSDVGGPFPVAQVPTGAIASQLRQYPVDGTFVIGYGQTTVYEVVGGALLVVSSWSSVDGPFPTVTIDSAAFNGGFLSYPASGTYLQGYQIGDEFLSNGSSVTSVTTTPLPPAIPVDDWAILNQLGGTE